MDETPPIGWVLYDDACGFCRRWVPFWRGTLRKRGFAIAPLQSEWGSAEVDLTLLLVGGGQVRGADVYRYVMRRIWWAYPLYLLSRAPLLRRAFDWGYSSFAVNRHRFSRACRLPGAPRTDDLMVERSGSEPSASRWKREWGQTSRS